MVGNIPFLSVIIARYALKKISLPVANTRYSEMPGFVDLNPSPIFFDKRYSFTKGPHKRYDDITVTIGKTIFPKIPNDSR